MNVALHVHTNFSACSESKLPAIAEYCRRGGIDAIAITDHNRIDGALAFAKEAPDLHVIIGEEISTMHGEVVGLFLSKKIEAGGNLRETCIEIKRQGGLVYVPHPFDKFKVHRVRRRRLSEIIDLVDIIEVFNAKISLPMYNVRALHVAERFGKVGAVGSDSHFVASIGSAINIMEPFTDPASFLENLRQARFHTEASGLLSTWWVRMRKMVS